MKASFNLLDNVTPDDRKEAVIKLAYPVTLADRQLDSVTMRRPTMGDIIDYEPVKLEDMKGEVALIGVLCGLKEQEMRLLDATDYARLQKQYVQFRAVSE